MVKFFVGREKLYKIIKKRFLVFWLKRLEWDKEKETWEKDHGFNKGQRFAIFISIEFDSRDSFYLSLSSLKKEVRRINSR